MNLAEKILVVIDPEVSYNICKGGHGGFGYIQQHINYKKWAALGGKNKSIQTKLLLDSNATFKSEFLQKNQCFSRIKIGFINYRIKYPKSAFFGKKHSQETKNKISLSQKDKHNGKKNSQYGTCWITNGKENKKIPKDDLDKYIEIGYYKGRIIL